MAEPPEVTPPKTVLVIEDDKSIRNMIRDILEISGYQVLTACDGKEGINLLSHSEHRPDVILLDIWI